MNYPVHHLSSMIIFKKIFTSVLLITISNILSKSMFIYCYLSCSMDILNGRRIVDIGHIFNEIQNSRHSGGFGCSFLDMIFKREEINGFFSIFYFHCKMCGIEKKYLLKNLTILNVFQ